MSMLLALLRSPRAPSSSRKRRDNAPQKIDTEMGLFSRSSTELTELKSYSSAPVPSSSLPEVCKASDDDEYHALIPAAVKVDHGVLEATSASATVEVAFVLELLKPGAGTAKIEHVQEAFERLCWSGSVLCKLLSSALPGSLDERTINCSEGGFDLRTGDILENFQLCHSCALAQGCDVQGLNAERLRACEAGAVADFVLEVLRVSAVQALPSRARHWLTPPASQPPAAAGIMSGTARSPGASTQWAGGPQAPGSYGRLRVQVRSSGAGGSGGGGGSSASEGSSGGCGSRHPTGTCAARRAAGGLEYWALQLEVEAAGLSSGGTDPVASEPVTSTAAAGAAEPAFAPKLVEAAGTKNAGPSAVPCGISPTGSSSALVVADLGLLACCSSGGPVAEGAASEQHPLVPAIPAAATSYAASTGGSSRAIVVSDLGPLDCSSNRGPAAEGEPSDSHPLVSMPSATASAVAAPASAATSAAGSASGNRTTVVVDLGPLGRTFSRGRAAEDVVSEPRLPVSVPATAAAAAGTAEASPAPNKLPTFASTTGRKAAAAPAVTSYAASTGGSSRPIGVSDLGPLGCSSNRGLPAESRASDPHPLVSVPATLTVAGGALAPSAGQKPVAATSAACITSCEGSGAGSRTTVVTDLGPLGRTFNREPAAEGVGRGAASASSSPRPLRSAAAGTSTPGQEPSSVSTCSSEEADPLGLAVWERLAVLLGSNTPAGSGAGAADAAACSRVNSGAVVGPVSPGCSSSAASGGMAAVGGCETRWVTAAAALSQSLKAVHPCSTLPPLCADHLRCRHPGLRAVLLAHALLALCRARDGAAAAATTMAPSTPCGSGSTGGSSEWDEQPPPLSAEALSEHSIGDATPEAVEAAAAAAAAKPPPASPAPPLPPLRQPWFGAALRNSRSTGGGARPPIDLLSEHNMLVQREHEHRERRRQQQSTDGGDRARGQATARAAGGGGGGPVVLWSGDGDDVEGEDQEERVLRLWLNSLDPGIHVTSLFEIEVTTGWPLLLALEAIQPGCVSWSDTFRPPFKEKLRKILSVQNCNHVIEVCTRQLAMPPLVNIGGLDLALGQRRATLSLVFQIMRHHMGMLLGLVAPPGSPRGPANASPPPHHQIHHHQLHHQLHQHAPHSPAQPQRVPRAHVEVEKAVLAWANAKLTAAAAEAATAAAAKGDSLSEQVSGAAEPVLGGGRAAPPHPFPPLGSFSDRRLGEGQVLLQLLAAICPSTVNPKYVLPGRNVEERGSNARYLLSCARKIGCVIFLVWEDVVAARPNLLLLLLASLMALDRKRAGAAAMAAGASGSVGEPTPSAAAVATPAVGGAVVKAAASGAALAAAWGSASSCL